MNNIFATALTPANLLFYIIAILTIAAAYWVLATRNIIRAAVGLLFALFGIGAMYLFLAADFLAFVQLFIYIGGIMVLIMFGIMLTKREEKGTSEEATQDKVELSQKLESRGSTLIGLVIAGGVFMLLYIVLFLVGSETWAEFGHPENSVDTAEVLGEKLLTEYIFPFEIVSVFLMIALIGAAYIARRKDISPRTSAETQKAPEEKQEEQ